MASTLEEALELASEAQPYSTDNFDMLSTDHIFFIDVESRTIKVPDQERVFGVYNDADAEKKYFSIPRYLSTDLDVTECQIRINYVNAVGRTGRHVVNDTRLKDGQVQFYWDLKRDITEAAGQIMYAVCIAKIANDGQITREWNTRIATGDVLEGIEVDDPLPP